MASKSTLLGAAGEHHVMAELLRRGYIAALAPAGVPNADIVVTDVEGGRLCSIQVKTRRELGSDGGWHMKARHEKIQNDRLFYCFVDFGKTPEDCPSVHVLPSPLVAKVLAETHAKWLSVPGRGGRQHRDGPMRRLLPDYGKLYAGEATHYRNGWLDRYRNAWQLLNLDATPDVETEADPE
jgi:hypothetical protein